MNARNNFKNLINKIAGQYGLRVIGRRHALDVCLDVVRTELNFKTVFDVGANIGCCSRLYLDTFPNANVYAFEPVSENCENLKSINNSRFQYYCNAVGDAEQDVDIYLAKQHSKHSIFFHSDNQRREKVKMVTIDEFCRRKNIDQINFLKVDTEGADLKVLQGALAMLDRQAIDFVQVETCFEEGRIHVPFWVFQEFLSPKGYRFFGLYDQSPEWNGAAAIQFANACFARKGLCFAT